MVRCAIATIAGIAREKAIKKVMSPIEPLEGRSLMFFFFYFRFSFLRFFPSANIICAIPL